MKEINKVLREHGIRTDGNMCIDKCNIELAKTIIRSRKLIDRLIEQEVKKAQVQILDKQIFIEGGRC